GGVANAAALLRYLSDTCCGTRLGAAPPMPQPEHGIYHPNLPAGPVAAPQEYLALRGSQPGRPRIGLLFYRAHWLSGNLAFVDALVRALAAHGCEALPVFCDSLRPPEPSHESVDSRSIGGCSAGACPPPDDATSGRQRSQHIIE